MKIVLDEESLKPIIAEAVRETLDGLERDQARLEGRRLAYLESEAAAIIGVPSYTLRDIRLKGEIESTRIGRRVAYERQALLDYLARNRTQYKNSGPPRLMSGPLSKENLHMDGNTETLLVKKIHASSATQTRVLLDEQIVAEYAEAMQAGATFPPIVVYREGKRYWLADGFHRLAAAKRAEVAEIVCEVRRGGLPNALAYAAGCNAEHGLRRSNADKRRAVRLLLECDEFADSSNRAIANSAKVDHKTVAAVRRELEVGKSPPDASALGKVGKQPAGSIEDRMKAVSDALERAIQEGPEQALADIRNLPNFDPTRLEIVEDQLARAMATVRGGKPYKPCPKCSGDGCGKCRQLGWMNRVDYESHA